MAKKDDLKKVAKAHIIYKTSDGTRVPGATTITGLLNKPYLIKWANDLGMEDIDVSKYVDEAASIGSLAHEMVQCHLQKQEVDLDKYSKIQIDKASNSFLSYLEWEKQHTIEPIFCETAFTSDNMRFGGTVDCYCNLDGIPTLVDFKTGKAIYNEYFVQVGAYRELLKEAGHPVDRVMILRIGRSEDEGFEIRSIDDTTKYFQIFKDLLHVYYLKKELKWS